MNKVIAIPAYNDNYIWLITSQDQSQACVIDPGLSEPVLEYLQSHSINLHSILVTHNHYDHVDGINDLCQAFPDCQVYGPTLEKVPNIDFLLSDKDIVEFDNLRFEVMDVPGHTVGHIAYHCQQEQWLFSGDTLFGMGCGRLLGGTAEQLYQSLHAIAKLPPDTQVYCTHEYTQANIAFACAVEPDNTAITEHQKHVAQLRANDKRSVPLSLKYEIQNNPFLRCHETAIKQAVEVYSQQQLQSPLDVFAQLRLWKDRF